MAIMHKKYVLTLRIMEQTGLRWKKRNRKIMTINMGLLCLGTRYKKFLNQKEVQIKIFSVLNVSNGTSKAEEFSLKDIEVLADSEEQNWFKRADVGKFLGLSQIEKLLVGLISVKYVREMTLTQPILPLPAGVDLRIIKTRQTNSSQPLGSCMSLQNLKKTRVRHLRSTS